MDGCVTKQLRHTSRWSHTTVIFLRPTGRRALLRKTAAWDLALALWKKLRCWRSWRCVDAIHRSPSLLASTQAP